MWRLYVLILPCFLTIVTQGDNVIEVGLNGEGGNVKLELARENAIHWDLELFNFCNAHIFNAELCFNLHAAVGDQLDTILGDDILYPTNSSWKMIPPDDVEIEYQAGLIERFIKCNKSIAVIGAEGYIGSYLHDTLHGTHDITGYTKSHRIALRRGFTVKEVRSDDISDDELLSYDVVIYLGGLTSRACLNLSSQEVFQENVLSPFKFALRMSPTQLFIFATSGAIAKGSGTHPHHEDDDTADELNVYAESMRRREYSLRHLSAHRKSYSHPDDDKIDTEARPARGPVMVGLRLGVVVGVSRRQRTAGILPAWLLRSAYTEGHISVHANYAAVRHSFLSLDDLGRAVYRIITNSTLLKYRFQIFNLQSVSATLESTAGEVASLTGFPVSIASDRAAGSYDLFASGDCLLDTRKFEDVFDFRFKDTVRSMVRNLIENLPMSIVCEGNHEEDSDKGQHFLPKPCSLSTHAPEKKRRNIVLISSFYNEELLLPFWIRHHARYFDEAILIDYQSTDRSAEIIREQAPAGWRIVNSRNKVYHHELMDREVMWYERKHRDAWKICLCTTEFLMAKNLRVMLESYEERHDLDTDQAGSEKNFAKVLKIPALSIIGDDSTSLNPHDPLVLQRSVYGLLNQTRLNAVDYRGKEIFEGVIWPGYSREVGKNIYSRFMHVGLSHEEFQYAPGRHEILLLHPRHMADILLVKDAFLMKFVWTPWPEVRSRKIQIGGRIPAASIVAGFQHRYVTNSSDRANELHDFIHAMVDTYDLKETNYLGLEPEHANLHRIYKEAVSTIP